MFGDSEKAELFNKKLNEKFYGTIDAAKTQFQSLLETVVGYFDYHINGLV